MSNKGTVNTTGICVSSDEVARETKCITVPLSQPLEGLCDFMRKLKHEQSNKGNEKIASFHATGSFTGSGTGLTFLPMSNQLGIL